MDELVQQLMNNAGLTEEQAVKAIHTMKDFIMGKVPPMFSGFVDGFFSGKVTQNEEEDPLA
jgi:hypothetical protein